MRLSIVLLYQLAIISRLLLQALVTMHFRIVVRYALLVFRVHLKVSVTMHLVVVTILTTICAPLKTSRP